MSLVEATGALCLPARANASHSGFVFTFAASFLLVGCYRCFFFCFYFYFFATLLKVRCICSSSCSFGLCLKPPHTNAQLMFALLAHCLLTSCFSAEQYPSRKHLGIAAAAAAAAVSPGDGVFGTTICRHSFICYLSFSGYHCPC